MCQKLLDIKKIFGKIFLQKLKKNFFFFQSCSKCTNIKEERDRLKTQLNREISLKNKCLATNDDLDKKLQEARKTIEEMRRKQLGVCNDIIEKGRNDRRVLLNNRPEGFLNEYIFLGVI